MHQKIKPLDIEKALYGKSETKRSIINIVTAVFNQYKFASLPEFNAALKQFNVVVDRGNDEKRHFFHLHKPSVYIVSTSNSSHVENYH